MKRVLLLVPQGVRMEQLTDEQQDAIRSVYAEQMLPMHGTRPYAGYEVCDGVTADNFDPSVMEGLGLPFPVIGLWAWPGGHLPLVEEVALDWPSFANYLAPVPVYDHRGDHVRDDPAPLRLPMNWAGWPRIPAPADEDQENA